MSESTLDKGVSIGWYGKLPCSGDFVSRRIPRSLLDIMDEWLGHGLAEMRAADPDHWRESFAAAPAWNCALPACATGGSTLIGLVAPSRDRVGREFPICAGVALPADAPTGQLLADAHGWLWSLGRTVIEARDRAISLEAFDEAIRSIELPRITASSDAEAGMSDIIDIIGPSVADVPTVPMPLAYALPWPELPTLFDATEPTCFWWTNTSAGGPLRGFTTELGLAPSLFVRLMQPLPGSVRSKG